MNTDTKRARGEITRTKVIRRKRGKVDPTNIDDGIYATPNGTSVYRFKVPIAADHYYTKYVKELPGVALSKAWLYGAAYSFILFIILRRITLINHVNCFALSYK